MTTGGESAPESAFGEPVGTPAGWRVAAAVALTAALGAGLGAARWLSVRALLALGAAVVAGYVAPLVRGSRRPPLPPLEAAALPPPQDLPSVTVLVAARDEAAVLPELVADLAAQDHRDPDGRPRFEIVVIDDRSTDGSGHAVLATATRQGVLEVTRVIRRGPPESAGPAAVRAAGLPDGKGAALTAAPPEVCRGDVVAVLDADARVAPDFLRRTASYFARGADAMTARRRIVTSGLRGLRRRLAEAQDDEQTADGEIQRGRWHLGGCSEFRGNGILIRRDRLEQAGGWRAEALCEDLDLSTRLAAATGARVGWAIDAPVWEEPVLEFRALWRQRARWAEGIVRRQLDLTLPLLRSRRVTARAKLDYLAYSSQTLMPLSLFGALLGGVLFRHWRPVVGLGAIYLAAGTVLAADALRWERDEHDRRPPLRERLVRGLRVTLFASHWLLAFTVGWGRIAVGQGPMRYVKMDHRGAPPGWRPASAATAATAPSASAPPRASRWRGDGTGPAAEAAPVPERADA